MKYLLVLLALCVIVKTSIGNAFTYNTRNWMKDVNGNIRLNQLAIPGTHDSGAYDTRGNIGETQDWNINEQLENGIRFLDIRISNWIVQNDFEIRHELLMLGSFNNLVMKRVNDFLARNPTETILMSIKNEGGALDNTRLERDYIRSSHHKFYQGVVTPKTKLKYVRGKIVLFNRYNDNNRAIGIRWRDIGYIQDVYELNTECKTIDLGICTTKRICSPLIGLNYPEKARLVTKYLKIAKEKYGGNHFIVNFASANYQGMYIGNSAKYSNAAVKKYFDSNQRRVGTIVPMDYPNRKSGVISSMIRNSLAFRYI